MKISMNLRKSALLAGAVLLSTGAMALPAEEIIVTETEVVRYSIQESATPQGAKALYRKLQAAASRVCSTDMPATKVVTVDRICIAEALTRAVADTGNPLLLVVHQQNNPDYKTAGLVGERTAEAETFANR